MSFCKLLASGEALAGSVVKERPFPPVNGSMEHAEKSGLKTLGLLYPNAPISDLRFLLFPISALNLTWETCQSCVLNIICGSLNLIRS